ncbi:MAG: hypothetical protein F6K48_20690 [Okeania sp. SIO3H1]|nr:hypothetical protein [Okeania sp. SIO3H1]
MPRQNFNEGDSVLLVTQGSRLAPRTYTRAVVKKVYPSGNFELVGDPENHWWKQDGHRTSRKPRTSPALIRIYKDERKIIAEIENEAVAHEARNQLRLVAQALLSVEDIYEAQGLYKALPAAARSLTNG